MADCYNRQSLVVLSSMVIMSLVRRRVVSFDVTGRLILLLYPQSAHARALQLIQAIELIDIFIDPDSDACCPSPKFT